MISFIKRLGWEGYLLETISQGARKGVPHPSMGPGPRGMQDRPWLCAMAVFHLDFRAEASLLTETLLRAADCCSPLRFLPRAP